jgi:alkylation response protein AidB-like acyl-CoA dehydrogenase
MDWTEPPEVAAFRDEVRAWLAANLDPSWRGLRFEMEAGRDWVARMKAWSARLADAGYATIAWPAEFGGRGAGLLEQVALAEELDHAQAPPALNLLGISNIAPAILRFGTEDQKRRYLPPMARGDEIWCQGFSEPDAGSDLASLSTRAVRDGDDYVVDGQKVWSTLGHVADWCQLLVRTDPSAPRHRGITCLLVDLHARGVEVRPLVTITGETEFAELFFTEVRVPSAARLGEENDGWNVAMTTLMNERGSVAALHLGLRRRIGELIETARVEAPERLADPSMRRRLAALHLHGETLRRLADRAISGAIHDRPFGPESSLAKLVWSDVEQELAEVTGDLFGMDALGGSWGRERLRARSYSIAGGTTQVNKNIIATRILNLPRG